MFTTHIFMCLIIHIKPMLLYRIFLQLDQCFNDYEATLIWTRRYLEKHPECEYSDIQKAFVSCFPEHFFSFDC